MRVTSPAAWCSVSGWPVGRCWAKSSFGQGQQSVPRAVEVPEGRKDRGAPHHCPCDRWRSRWGGAMSRGGAVRLSSGCFIRAVVNQCLPSARGLEQRALAVTERGSTEQRDEAASWWNRACPIYVRREPAFVYILKFAVFYCSFSKRINHSFSPSLNYC